MAKKNDSAAWYGELRTKRGNTIVIRDDELPPAAPGRIYLFNTERGAMVQYDEAIVSEKLFELDDEQIKQAQSQFKSAWEAARKQLSKANGKPIETTEGGAKPSDDILLDNDDDSDIVFDDED